MDQRPATLPYSFKKKNWINTNLYKLTSNIPTSWLEWILSASSEAVNSELKGVNLDDWHLEACQSKASLVLKQGCVISSEI